MESCEGCKALEARLEAAEKAIEELRGRVEGAGSKRAGSIGISIPKPGVPFTSPGNGYVTLRATSIASGSFLSVKDSLGMCTSIFASAVAQNLSVHLPVQDGLSLQVDYASISNPALSFFPYV